MRISTLLNIPPKGFSRYNRGLTDEIRKLNIGDFVEFSHKRAKNCYNCAQQIGMKVVTRRFGDVTRVYRIK